MRRGRGRSQRCFDVFAALVAGLSLGLVPVQASAAEKDLTNKGKVLVKENCSRCHAIGKEGNSPHPEAPPFRTLSSRYPIEDLSEWRQRRCFLPWDFLPSRRSRGYWRAELWLVRLIHVKGGFSATRLSW
jgi:Cytochrome c